MRCGYSDDGEQLVKNMWRGRVASAMRGKRGQKLLRDCLYALDAMPEKRLIRDELVDETGEVCLLGAVGRARGVADIAQIDPTEHKILGERFNVAYCMIKEIEFINDDYGYQETPEKRYQRVRRWLVDNIKITTSPPCNERIG